MDWMGVDVHNIADAKSGNITANMVCAAREISVDSCMMTTTTAHVPNILEPWNGHERANHFMFRSKACTELMAWKKLMKHGKYSYARYACRLDGSPYYMEVCPVKDRVYACFSSSSGELPEDAADELNAQDDEEQHVHSDVASVEENLMMDHDDIMRIK